MLSLAGCAVPEYLNGVFFQSAGPGGDRVVAASLDSVALSTQGTLHKLGLNAVVTNEGEAVRIASKTSKGNGFTIVLTRVSTDKGENTRVHLEWEKNAEDPVGNQFFGLLDAEIKG